MNQFYYTWKNIFLHIYLGFEKDIVLEQCLIMLEIWKKALDEKKVAGTIFTDLSKAYGFENQAINFIKSYLKERKQRAKIPGTILNMVFPKAVFSDLYYLIYF